MRDSPHIDALVRTPQPLSVRRRATLLILLTLIHAFSLMDRVALGFVLQDIKLEFQLSDTQLGLLTGLAFTLFYSTMGLPLARWADTGNRRVLVSLTTALWSGAVAVSAFTMNFIQLIAARVGVAVGEAGCVPAGHSLIADYYDRLERPRAMAVYMTGGNLAVIFGAFFGGWINEFYGWRAMFVVFGIAGLMVAPLAFLFLSEPRELEKQRTQAANPHESRKPPTFRSTLSHLRSSKTFGHLLGVYAVASFFGAGISVWMPSFFIRTYDMTSGVLGTWFMLIAGLCGIVGTYFGGNAIARLAAGNEPRQLRIVAASYALFGAASAGMYVVDNVYAAFALMGLSIIGVAGTGPIFFATLQTLLPPQMRASAIALIYLAANLVGMGLGPLLAGALSDLLTPHLGPQSLRYTLLALCIGYAWAALHSYRASHTIRAELQRDSDAAVI